MYERRHEWSLELLRTKVPKILFGSLCYITYPLLSTLAASVRLMPDERVSQYFTQSTIHWYFPLFVSPLPLCHFTHAVVGHLTSWENIYLLYLFYLYRQFTDISSTFKAVAHSRIWGTTQQCSFDLIYKVFFILQLTQWSAGERVAHQRLTNRGSGNNYPLHLTWIR